MNENQGLLHLAGEVTDELENGFKREAEWKVRWQGDEKGVGS